MANFGRWGAAAALIPVGLFFVLAGKSKPASGAQPKPKPLPKPKPPSTEPEDVDELTRKLEEFFENKPTALPSNVDPVRDARLFIPATFASPTELDWALYIRDPRSGAPALVAADESQATGVTRGLTAYERWALDDFFIKEDLATKLHIGAVPPDWVGREIPEGVAAMTDHDTGEIYFPAWVPLTSLFFLSVLAHELTHAAQIRMGLTFEEGVDAFTQWGYVDSPIEVQARWKQRQVLDTLSGLAKALVGPKP